MRGRMAERAGHAGALRKDHEPLLGPSLGAAQRLATKGRPCPSGAGPHVGRRQIRPSPSRAPPKFGQPARSAGPGRPHFNTGKGTSRVYPRGRGGTREVAIPLHLPFGLSPRARGNHSSALACTLRMGSIPAGAGEPISSGSMKSPRWVYPRGRGGTTYMQAGISGGGVYPRGRGGTGSSSGRAGSPRGLSPRARGNQQAPRSPNVSGGSIPAGAGEPLSGGVSPARTGVYPRGRGGTIVGRSVACPNGGLSPRARGNPTGLACLHNPVGSIPAGAGEPHPRSSAHQRDRVYPRGRGGTIFVFASSETSTGLSPRARGNLAVKRSPVIGRGVYPRGRGGTVAIAVRLASVQGLSPRARGNRRPP